MCILDALYLWLAGADGAYKLSVEPISLPPPLLVPKPNLANQNILMLPFPLRFSFVLAHRLMSSYTISQSLLKNSLLVFVWVNCSENRNRCFWKGLLIAFDFQVTFLSDLLYWLQFGYIICEIERETRKGRSSGLKRIFVCAMFGSRWCLFVALIAATGVHCSPFSWLRSFAFSDHDQVSSLCFTFHQE